MKLVVHLLLIAGVGAGVFTVGRSSTARAVEPAVAEAEASESTTEPAGQADLDAAIEQKLSARSLEDFERVVDLCRRALRKGLAKESQAFADSLLVGTLIDRAGMLVDAIFDGPKPNPEWPRMRTFAMRDLSEAVRRSPDLGTAHLMIARLQALPGGNQKAAVLAANKAIELLTPGQAERLQLAEAHLVRGNLADDPAARKADYDKAVEIAPADADIRQTRGLFLLLQNDFGPAREDLRVAIEQDPEEAGLHEALGMAYMMDNGLEDDVRLEKARESFDKAIAIAPGAAGPLLQRARVLAMQGEQPEAIADLDKAVEMAPENAVAR
ncbi:MAG: hypothetical protein EBZ13_05140, partial [Planctomycetia bacterium]|nr:hypothetical protein [Planctomycetia bacterium]